jgi:LPXTG-motif cell wall-anchored protein
MAISCNRQVESSGVIRNEATGMKEDILTFLAQKIKEQRFWKIQSAVSVLLIITVAGGTVFSLMKPAITLTGDAVHYHTKECYDGDAEPVQYLFCNADRLSIHEHTNACFATDETGQKTLICGIADYVIHQHDTIECTDEEGNLICGLAECLPLNADGGYIHYHTIECYQPDGFSYHKVTTAATDGTTIATTSDAATATSSDAVAATNNSETAFESEEGMATSSNAIHEPVSMLIHVATASDASEKTDVSDDDQSDREKKKLIEEIQSNRNEIPEELILTGTLICGLQGTSEDEIDWDEMDVEELEEYLQDEVELLDDIHPKPAMVRSAPREGIFHEHDDSCYDTGGIRICGLLETQEHVHGEECYIWYQPLICEKTGVQLWEQELLEEENEAEETVAEAELVEITATPTTARKLSRMLKSAAGSDSNLTAVTVECRSRDALNSAWSSLTDTDGDGVPEVSANDLLRFTLKYTMDSENLAEDNPQIIDQLPEELTINEVQEGDVLDEKGESIGQYTIETDGSITASLENSGEEETISDETIQCYISIVYPASAMETDEDSKKTLIFSDASAIKLKVVNDTNGYVLPQTGGSGTLPYTMGGLLMLFTSAGTLMYKRNRRKEDMTSS